MESFLVFLCVILMVPGFVQANECFIDGRVFQVGDKFSLPGKCIQMECTRPNESIGKTCPDVQSFQPCKYIPQDNSKPFPQCCPRLKC